MVRNHSSRLGAFLSRPENRPTLTTVGIFLLLSVVAILIAYRVPLSFNVYGAASAVFLFSALYVALREGPLRTAFERCWSYLHRPVGAAIFVSYLAIHYLLYGLFLEQLLLSTYGYAPINAGSSVFLSTGLVNPETPVNVLLSMISVPALNLWIAPDYGMSLVPFSLFMGFLIAVLVTANIETVVHAASCPRPKRWTALYVLPTLGVAAGASCCLSLPILLTLVIPTVGALTYTVLASYAAFFLFPAATAYALYLNLHRTRILLERYGRLAAQVPHDPDPRGEVSP
jgi:hypothetical protein